MKLRSDVVWESMVLGKEFGFLLDPCTLLFTARNLMVSAFVFAPLP